MTSDVYFLLLHRQYVSATNSDLYSFCFRLFELNGSYSFGQVVAITVWVPSLIEYINLEIRKNCILHF